VRVKTLIVATALLVAGFLIGGLVCRGDSSGAEQRADSLRTIADSLLAQDAQRSRDSAMAAVRILQLERNNRTLEAVALVVSRRVDSLRALVVRDSAVPFLLHESIVAGLDSIVELRTAQRDSNEAKYQQVNNLYRSADSASNRWRGLYQSTQRQLDAALKRYRWGCVGGVSATAGYGFVGDRAGAGTVAGVGVTCGKRL
jgi:hypothetical protein